MHAHVKYVEKEMNKKSQKVYLDRFKLYNKSTTNYHYEQWLMNALQINTIKWK